MAGFVLGTGSGILAATAVYYTLSTSVQNRTSALRSELYNSSQLLQTSFDPDSPIPASALIGPSSNSPLPPRPPFSQLVQAKWNSTVASSLKSLEETNWTAISRAAYEEGKSLIGRLTGSGSDLVGVGNRESLVKAPDVRTVSGGNVRDREERVDGKVKSEIKRVVEAKAEGRLV